MVGGDTEASRLAGPPAPMIASLSMEMILLVHSLAVGCALNTTALPAAIIPMALETTVAVGLVHGVMEPMTP